MVLAFEAWRGPVSEDQPAGELAEESFKQIGTSNDTLFTLLDEVRRSIERDPMMSMERHRAETAWKRLQEISTLILDHSRDVEVVSYLARSCLALDDLASFCSCLELIDHWREQEYWSQVHPAFVEGDPTARISRLEELAGPDTLYLLQTARVSSNESAPTLQETQERELAVDSSLGSALRTASKLAHNLEEYFEEYAEDAHRMSQDEDRPDPSYPTLNLEPLVRLLTVYAGDEPELAAEGETAEGTPDSEQADQSSAGLEVNGRSGVKSSLEQCRRYFKEQEPSSPVPVLLELAVRLVDKDYFEIVDLVGDAFMMKIRNLIKKDDGVDVNEGTDD